MKLRQTLRQALIFTMLISIFTSTVVQGAPPTATETEEQNRRARQEAEQRQQRDKQKDVFLQQKQQAKEDYSLPEETPSFVVDKLILEGECLEKFPWTKTMLDKYQGRKIGLEGINLISKRLTNSLIDRGYITSRVVIPEQDLSTGTLRLVLIPGRIGDIRVDEKSIQRNWRNAFPTRPGDILNLRNLEQGLEQMKRVPSQDVDFQLVPGKNPGASDIVITIKESKRYKFIFSVDDSGTKPTGKIQTSQTFSLDNLFGLNDMFNITLNGDGERKGGLRGTRGGSLYYSIPCGDTTFSFSAGNYEYHQTIDTVTQPFMYSGKSDNIEFHITQLLYRDQVSKTNLEYGISKKYSKSYMEDAEIEVQRKNTTAAQIGISHRRYFGQTTLNIEIDNKRGVPWFGAQADDKTPGMATTRYNMWLLDTSLTTPVTLAKTKAQYSLSFHGQYTDDLLYANEFISIGNRWTVRGFDGEETLAAERGWYLRNELDIPIGDSGHQVYLGLDYGQVSGPSAQYLTGRILAGAVLGLRGGSKVQYDVFAGWPLRKPENFRTDNVTYGFQLIYQM